MTLIGICQEKSRLGYLIASLTRDVAHATKSLDRQIPARAREHITLFIEGAERQLMDLRQSLEQHMAEHGCSDPPL